jgi:hypothetical protein
MFVRDDSGVRRFELLVGENDQRDVWTRLFDLQKKFQKTCPDCGVKFWIDYESINLKSEVEGGFIETHGWILGSSREPRMQLRRSWDTVG